MKGPPFVDGSRRSGRSPDVAVPQAHAPWRSNAQELSRRSSPLPSSRRCRTENSPSWNPLHRHDGQIREVPIVVCHRQIKAHRAASAPLEFSPPRDRVNGPTRSPVPGSPTRRAARRGSARRLKKFCAAPQTVIKTLQKIIQPIDITIVYLIRANRFPPPHPCMLAACRRFVAGRSPDVSRGSAPPIPRRFARPGGAGDAPAR